MYEANHEQLAATNSETPYSATEASLENCNLVEIVPEDLALFTSLTYLSLGANHIHLEWLVVLPALKELHLPCNDLEQIAPLPPGSFSNLQVTRISIVLTY